MFKKLRLRLTLANVTVVVLIFIVVFTGVYITMYKSIVNKPEQVMDLLTYSILSGGETQNNAFFKVLGNQSFIIAEISNSGTIIDYKSTKPVEMPPMADNNFQGKIIIKNISPVPEVKKEYVQELVDKTEKQGDKKGTLFKMLDMKNVTEDKPTVIMMKLNTVQSSTGDTYLTEILKKPDNTLYMIFVNMDYENSLLKSLRINLIMVAVAGLGLVYAGSLFMAGKAIKPIKESWERQKNFVADASHELRTPLTVIKTNLELVMESKVDTVESQLRWLENIDFENKHMIKLVSDLLLLARIDSGQKLLEMKNFSLSAAIEKAVAPYIPVAGEKNIKINFLIDSEVKFFGDESRMQQLVVILIDNAVKYTQTDGSIAIKLENSREGIELIVSDTGEGIGKEDFEKIFERFYRVDKARNTESGGTGLGLSIASWIVKEHHGTISVDSTLEKGTTFKIMFPIRKL